MVLLGVGVLIFLFPTTVYWGMAMLFGWAILFSGMVEVVLASSSRHYVTSRAWMLLWGVIEVVLGFVLIFDFTLSEEALPIYLAFWLLLRGFSAVGLASDLRVLKYGGTFWSLFSGLVLIFCALTILFQPSVYGAGSVVLWVGASFWVAGIQAILFGFTLRGAHLLDEQ